MGSGVFNAPTGVSLTKQGEGSKGKEFGNVPAATVRTLNKTGKLTKSRKAMQRLYPVETSDGKRENEKILQFPTRSVERARAESTS